MNAQHSNTQLHFKMSIKFLLTLQKQAASYGLLSTDFKYDLKSSTEAYSSKNWKQENFSVRFYMKFEYDCIRF